MKLRNLTLRRIICLPFLLILTSKNYQISATNDESIDDNYPVVDEEGLYCGYVKFPTNPETILNVTERHLIDPSLFQRVYDNKLENSSVHVENSRCEIKICGFTMGVSSVFLINNPHASGECTLFSQPVTALEIGPLTDQFQLTAVTCACKKPDYHDLDCLNFNYCSMLPVSPYLCANLYEEDKCKTCVYKEIEVKHGETFKTQNSAVINSVNVRDNCTLIRTIYGERHLAKRRQDFFNLGNAIIDPNYYKQSPDFTCTCNDFEVTSSEVPIKPSPTLETSTMKPSPTLETSTKIILATVTILTFLCLAAGSCIYRRKIKSRKTSSTTIGTNNRSSHIDSISRDPSDGLINQAILQNDFKLTSVDPDNRPVIIQLSALEEYSNSQFLIDAQYIQLGKLVGKGNFGVVSDGIVNLPEKEPNQKVAIKMLKDSAFQNAQEKAESVSSLMNEIKLISGIGKHPNLVEFLGISVLTTPTSGESFYAIVMELCGPRNLKEHLVSLREKLPKESQSPIKFVGYSDLPSIDKDYLFTMLLKWSMEIASGMDYLRSRNVLHKDLAARNVLLSSCGNLVAKISDFGLSRKLYGKNYYRMKTAGNMSANWSALECITDDTYTFESDVWSYGVTVWEIFNLGNDPEYPVAQNARTMDMFFNALVVHLRSGKRLPSPEFSTKPIYDKILSCWDEDPESRPNFRDLVHFFASLK